jgi:hypothetical protein
MSADNRDPKLNEINSIKSKYDGIDLFIISFGAED